jgi:hypothetical protein
MYGDTAGGTDKLEESMQIGGKKAKSEVLQGKTVSVLYCSVFSEGFQAGS